METMTVSEIQITFSTLKKMGMGSQKVQKSASIPKIVERRKSQKSGAYLEEPRMEEKVSPNIPKFTPARVTEALPVPGRFVLDDREKIPDGLGESNEKDDHEQRCASRCSATNLSTTPHTDIPARNTTPISTRV